MKNFEFVIFVKDFLREISKNLGFKSLTFFEYMKEDNIIRSICRLRDDIVFEHSEYVYIKDSEGFYNAVEKGELFVSKKAKNIFVYIPFDIEVLSEGVIKKYIIRVERFDGKNYSKRLLRKLYDLIKKKVSDFDAFEFEDLKKTYQKAIIISAKLGDVLSRGIREIDGFKFIIKEFGKLFNFDRIRLYIVNEEKNTLEGKYSIYRTGMIVDISCEVMVFSRGSSSLVDILLDNRDMVIKDYIVYIPLRIENKCKGILVLDNLLSVVDLNKYYLYVLNSFSSLITVAFENMFLFKKIEEMSLYDELSGLATRRYFNQKFTEEFYRAERFKQNLSLMWIDIDYFKEINDTYGHQIGDIVIEEISRVIKKTLRKTDFPSRYGGDEIVIILPQTSSSEAFLLAKRLNEEVNKISIDLKDFGVNKVISITISIGIANYPDDAKTMDELINKADEALYWVKSHGKNGIARWSEIEKGNGT